MSTKNIEYITKEYYLDKAQEKLLAMSDQYFYEKHYKIGEGIDSDKLDFYLQMSKSLCTENCELIEIINNTMYKGYNDINKFSDSSCFEEKQERIEICQDDTICFKSNKNKNTK